MLITGLIAATVWAVRAEHATRLAQESDARSRWMAYRSGMIVAQELAQTNPSQARRELDRLPQEHRNWEWDHLSHGIGIGLVEQPDDRRAGWNDKGLPISAGQDGSVIQLRNLYTGEFINRFTTVDPLQSFTLSPRARYLVGKTPSAEVAVVWNAETGEELYEFPTAATELSVVFSFDDEWFAAPLPNNETLTIRTAHTGQVESTIAMPEPLKNMRTGPGGELSIIAGRQITLLTSPRNQPLCDWQPTELNWAPLPLKNQNRTLVIPYQHSVAQLREISSSNMIAELHENFWTNGVGASIDGSMVATTYPNRIAVWDSSDGTLLAKVLSGMAGELRFSPEGDQLVSYGPFGVALWRFKQRPAFRCISDCKSTVYLLAISPDGTKLAAGGWEPTVRIWDMKSLAILQSFPIEGPCVDGLSFTEDGTQLVGTSSSEYRWLPERFYLWDVKDGRTVDYVQSPHTNDDAQRKSLIDRYFDTAQPGARRVKGGSENHVSSHNRAFRAQGLHNFESNSTVTLVDNETGGATEFPGRAVAFSRDDRWLATGDDVGIIRVFDVDTRKILAEMTGHESKIYTLVFSPDGTRLATGGIDETIRIWDTRTFESLIVLTGHTGYVHSLRFTPDGKQLISAGEDGLIRIWQSSRASSTDH